MNKIERICNRIEKLTDKQLDLLMTLLEADLEIKEKNRPQSTHKIKAKKI